MSLRVLLHAAVFCACLATGAISQAATTTLGTTDDACIDQHPNWADDTKGIPHLNWGWDGTELRVLLYDDADYSPAGMRQDVMLKWDVSGFAATDTVTGVTLKMAGWDGSDGPIDVYGIQAAANSWNENTVTWNNWAATTKSLVLLGHFACAGPANVSGDTLFADPNLAAWVQGWVNGTVVNNGLILKLSGANPNTPGSPYTIGDSFSAHEDTWSYGHAPQLVIDYQPLLSTISGKIAVDGYAGDMTLVGAQIELRQGGSVVRTERALLDAGGNFSFGSVALGTYDVSVKVCSQLPKIVHGVSVATGSTNLGTIVLKGGDFDGDGVINHRDLKIFASSWLFTANP